MAELYEQGTTWAAAKKITQNRTRWKVTVVAYVLLGTQKIKEESSPI